MRSCFVFDTSCIAFPAPLPLAGEHRPPSAAVLRKERRSEASATALGERGGWGDVSAGAGVWLAPPPQPSPASGRGSLHCARFQTENNMTIANRTVSPSPLPAR